MSEVVLLDTTIFLNILDVPGRNQDRDQVFESFREKIERGCHFLLPMATVWETGNHISRLPDGHLRRKFAYVMREQVSSAISGKLPFKATHFPEKREFLDWLTEFPEYAMRNKSDYKINEGVSLSDFSIIKEWNRTVSQNRSRSVVIWSLDTDLSAYRSNPIF